MPGHSAARPHCLQGFSLLELMIAVVVCAVLATLAYPAFMSVVRESRRAEALEALMLIQLRQERYRASNPSYGSLAQLGMSASTTGGYYTLSITSPSATGYIATATAVAGKSQTKDKEQGVSCSTLQVNQDEAIYTPAAQVTCWGR